MRMFEVHTTLHTCYVLVLNENKRIQDFLNAILQRRITSAGLLYSQLDSTFKEHALEMKHFF